MVFAVSLEGGPGLEPGNFPTVRQVAWQRTPWHGIVIPAPLGAAVSSPKVSKEHQNRKARRRVLTSWNSRTQILPVDDLRRQQQRRNVSQSDKTRLLCSTPLYRSPFT
ncbi:hypothetical protein M407DRAFT_114041 [Tulasnella calospora MUT 4182]|uniref:Uncharacterized protein n=1 Tax=Tulasnella calospora MUT 4182 TaxID=1051891 RepID=A0A0C3QCC0_9AGAM|nr:hypothetical protein M407DRAFT_114041 [Tulasnella calospora MUT 4182]